MAKPPRKTVDGASLKDKIGKAIAMLGGGSISWYGFEKTFPFLNQLASNLGFLSFIITGLLLPLHLANMLYGFIYSDQSHPSRFGMIVASGASIALGVIGLLAAVSVISIAAPILLVAGAARGLLENLWGLGVAIWDRLTAGLKAQADIKRYKNNVEVKIKANFTEDQIREDLISLTRLMNEQRERNAEIVKRLHGVALNIIGTVGAALLFSGATSAAGAGILIGVGIYGGLDALGLNPVVWLVKGANFISRKLRDKPLFEPFGTLTEEEVKARLVDELKAKDFHFSRSVPGVSDRLKVEEEMLGEDSPGRMLKLLGGRGKSKALSEAEEALLEEKSVLEVQGKVNTPRQPKVGKFETDEPTPSPTPGAPGKHK